MNPDDLLFLKEYDANHKACPVCGSSYCMETTTLGMVKPCDENYKDTNRAVCSCGWRGIVHDLVKEKTK